MTSMRHISLIVASLGMSLSLACTAFVHADTTKKNTTTVSQKTTKQTTRSDKGAKATCCDACKCEGQNKVAASSKSAETTCCGSCNHKEQAKAAA
ncbi:MAG: hypothetical protein NZ554_14385, partial [Bryobacteraceae bacterium]|nr:hypothetical protein [Bryobacteraceae bacterium]